MFYTKIDNYCLSGSVLKKISWFKSIKCKINFYTALFLRKSIVNRDTEIGTICIEGL